MLRSVATVCLTLGSTPTALSDQETAGQHCVIYFTTFNVHNRLLGLNHSAGLALIIDTNHLIAELKLATFAGGREWLQHRELALTIDTVTVVQVRHTGNVNSLLTCIEIGHLLISEFECYGS